MQRVLSILAALFCLVVVAIFLLQRRLIFPLHYLPPVPAEARLPSYAEQFWLQDGDAKIESWFLSGRSVSESNPGPVVIFFHGNAEVIDHLPAQLNTYRQLGISVALMEYRGYGRSTGSPSQDVLTRDAMEVYSRLVRRPDVLSQQVLFHGRSLGGGVACALAARYQPSALILESTFTSLRAMASTLFIPGFMVRDPFDNQETLGQLTVPILILHGRQDEMIPFRHAQVLAASNAQARLVPFQAGHNNLSSQRTLYWHTITAFLKSGGYIR